MVVDDFRKILEGFQLIQRHAVAARIHAAELPQGERIPLLGCEFQRLDRAGGVARIQVAGGSTHRIIGRRIGDCRRTQLTAGRVKRERWPRSQQQCPETKEGGARYPHSFVFLLRPLDG